MMSEKENEKENENEMEITDWIVLGRANDRLTADYIVETLRSYDIPAALNSRAGFLGDAGLTGLSSIFGNTVAAYEILTSAKKREEALDIASMAAGDNWERA